MSRAPELEIESESLESAFEPAFEPKLAWDKRSPAQPLTAPAAAAPDLVSALAVPERNLLAAAARAAEFTATFGAGVVVLESVAAFLPFSLHFSRSSTNSRAL